MLLGWRYGSWGIPRGLGGYLLVFLSVSVCVQAHFKITKVQLDKVQSIELSNEGGEILPQKVKAYVSTLGSTLDPDDFSALTATNVLSLVVTQLPEAGTSREYNIASFSVPQPEDVCGQYFLILTLFEGDGTSPYFQIPVSRTKDCQEDVDLKWLLEGDARDFSVSVSFDQNVVTNGAISSISVINDGNTDLAVRSATDAPDVMAFLSVTSTWQSHSLFSIYPNNNTLEMAVNEATNLELNYWLQNGMTNALELDGLSNLLVDLETGKSLKMNKGETVEVKFTDLKAPAVVLCSYSMLVLVIDPFERTKDSNRKNNYFFAPISISCTTGSGGCDVMAIAKSKGREAMITSWNYGRPTVYMFMEKNGKAGFSQVEYTEMNTKLKQQMMVKKYAKRLSELDLCTVENDAKSAVNKSIAMKLLSLVRTVRTSLADLTVTNNESKAEHNKVLKILELEDVMGNLALEKDGPVRYLMMKEIKKYMLILFKPGGILSQLGQQMGVDFSDILDTAGMGGTDGTGAAGREGYPGGMGGPQIYPSMGGFGGYPGMPPPEYSGQYPEMSGASPADGSETGGSPEFIGWGDPEIGAPGINDSKIGDPETGDPSFIPVMKGPELGGPETWGPGMFAPEMSDAGMNGNETGNPGNELSADATGSTGTEDVGGSESDSGTEEKAPCPTVECFAYGAFSCIDSAWLCDGNADCSDGQDENNCNDAGTPLGTRPLHRDEQSNVVNTDVEQAFHGLHGRGRGSPFGGGPFGGFPSQPPVQFPFPFNINFTSNQTGTPPPPPTPPPFSVNISGTGFVVGQNGTHIYITVNGTVYALPVNGTTFGAGVFSPPPPPPPPPFFGGGFGGPFGSGRPRPGRRPAMMHSGKFMWSGSVGQGGGHHPGGHGKGKRSPLQQMLLKITLRLAAGASAADLDELAFLDLQTRQLIKDVFDMVQESGSPQVFLPYTVAYSGEAAETMEQYKRQLENINPTEISADLFDSFYDFVKNNISVFVRESVKDDQTLTALLDLSLLYLDVFKAHADEIVSTVHSIVTQMMMDPAEIALLMKMSGPEPTEEMYCMRKAEEEMALKNPEAPKKKAVKFFHDPFAEIMEANTEKNSKPCYWKIEDGAVFRGERSEITGTMFWEKVALCSCNQEYLYRGYGGSPDYGHGDSDDGDDETDPLGFIFGGWKEEGKFGDRIQEGQQGGWSQGGQQGGGHGGWSQGDQQGGWGQGALEVK